MRPWKLILLFIVNFPLQTHAVSPAAVGWGNIILPGFGATLRRQPVRGLLEASTEIGTYYGGTFFGREGVFNIDNSVIVPDTRATWRPLTGEVLQEFGLKLHMFNTFYHYQQASLDPENLPMQLEYQQPLYKGNWDDVLLAPFRWKNLKEPWVLIPVALISGYLIWDYKQTPLRRAPYVSGPADEALYGFAQGVAVPLGSSFGEEVLFRGFIQREFLYYTKSLPLSILVQTILFTSLHAPHLRPGAFVGGIYFGLTVNHFDGDLEQAIATHFWADFISGILVYFRYRKFEGKSVPLGIQFQIPIW